MGAGKIPPGTTAAALASPRPFLSSPPKAATIPPAVVDPLHFHSRSDPCDSFLTSREDSRSPLREHEKLYDEEWWYCHLEERRQGGAPPDAMIAGSYSPRGRHVESIPEEYKCKEEEDVGLQSPYTGSMAAPDEAAGGVWSYHDSYESNAA